VRKPAATLLLRNRNVAASAIDMTRCADAHIFTLNEKLFVKSG
jgi:hypothetical protein